MQRLFLLFSLLIGVCLPLAAQDEAALQGFVDEAIKAGRGEVVIPPGEYVISKGLLLHGAKNISLAGMDKERTVLRLDKDLKATSDFAMIKIDGSSDNLLIRNLTLDAGGNVNVTALLATDIKALRIEDCLFQNGFQNAITLQRATECLIVRCSLRDIANAGIKLDQSSEKCELRGNRLTRCGVGIQLQDTVACLAVANELLNCGNEGISATGKENQLVDNVIEPASTK